MVLRGRISFVTERAADRSIQRGDLEAIQQNVKDLLSSPEIENILENSDFICMLNQAAGDRKILAERLNISPEQLKFVTNSPPGEGLLFFENVILPFADKFPRDTELYRIMSTKPSEVNGV